jgi:hypothetical protein
LVLGVSTQNPEENRKCWRTVCPTGGRQGRDADAGAGFPFAWLPEQSTNTARLYPWKGAHSSPELGAFLE